MRIAVVGPTHPFKGGIAQHTTELARQLSRAGHSVSLVSWDSQYPARLYPGELVVPDGAVEVPLTVPVHRVLNWYDPTSWWRAGTGLREADAIVIAHSNPFQVPAYRALLTSASRGSSTPTRILIAHNVSPHESGSWQERAVDQFGPVVDIVIVHSEQEHGAAVEHLPSAEIRCIPLAPHGPAMDAAHGAANHRRVWHDGDRIRLLAFGFIRPYKGLPLLLEAMKSAPQLELTIRGECWDDTLDGQLRLAAADPSLIGRVDYRSGYVSSAEIDSLFAHHDVAVLPYLEATGSQNTSLAQAHGRPVIVSDIPVLTSGVENGVNGLIVAAGNQQAWSQALARLSFDQVELWSKNITPVDPATAWQDYVDAIIRPPAERSTGSSGVRQAHVVSDPASRAAKAQAIASTLFEVVDLEGAAILDDGCGSGYIAAHLAVLVGPHGSVVGVDQVDERQTSEGYQFHLLDGGVLPFADASFDIVVSNHVLEHVGSPTDQRSYLREIRRVLRPGGWLYLAVPNKYRLVEAHYRLPVLSWLPQGAADQFVSRTGRGEWYDVTPVSRSGLHALLRDAGLHATDITADVARRELGKLPGQAASLARVPDSVLRPALRIAPTFVVLAQRM
jgi:glycosyltransferase involved in cell wall biosynthesis